MQVDFFVSTTFDVLDDSDEVVPLNFDVVGCAVEHRNIRDSMFVGFNQVRSPRDIRIVDEAYVSDARCSRTGY